MHLKCAFLHSKHIMADTKQTIGQKQATDFENLSVCSEDSYWLVKFENPGTATPGRSVPFV
jgi:hypothetical protein